ncbi:MAG: hypothetical protein ACLRXS_19625 [Bacteroides ovatus]
MYDLNLADGTLQGTVAEVPERYLSYIAKVNYDYAEKYLIELVGRRDGNSKFADGYRFQNYGSSLWVGCLHKRTSSNPYLLLSVWTLVRCV